MNDLLAFLASSGIGFHEPRYMGHRPKPKRKGPAKFSMHGRKMRYHFDLSPRIGGGQSLDMLRRGDKARAELAARR